MGSNVDFGHSNGIPLENWDQPITPLRFNGEIGTFPLDPHWFPLEFQWDAMGFNRNFHLGWNTSNEIPLGPITSEWDPIEMADGSLLMSH